VKNSTDAMMFVGIQNQKCFLLKMICWKCFAKNAKLVLLKMFYAACL
jgi:hypothetical protein